MAASTTTPTQTPAADGADPDTGAASAQAGANGKSPQAAARPLSR